MGDKVEMLRYQIYRPVNRHSFQEKVFYPEGELPPFNIWRDTNGAHSLQSRDISPMITNSPQKYHKCDIGAARGKHKWNDLYYFGALAKVENISAICESRKNRNFDFKPQLKSCSKFKCGSKSKFWSIIEILVKNIIFDQKLKFWLKVLNFKFYTVCNFQPCD